MKKVIHRLRQKSEKERRQILYFIIIVLAFFLILLWTFTLGRTITSREAKIKVQQDLQPFSAFKASLVDGYNSIGGNTSSNTNQ